MKLLREYALNMQGEWNQMKRGEPLCLYSNFQHEREVVSAHISEVAVI